MDSLSRYDAAGYAVPFAADLEIEAAALALLGNIPASADDEPDWDAAWDEPMVADRSWWARECEAKADGWEEYARWSAWQDALEAAHPRVSDADIMAVGCAG